ncbi:MAG: hypothetical protein ABEI78_01085, partial [Candidatus Nanohaloarchaea archaeon]
KFEVTRIFDYEFRTLENVDPGETFKIQLKWKEPAGEPISTRSFVYVTCKKCPSDYKVLDLNKTGIYQGKLYAPNNTEDISIRVFANDFQGNSESQETLDPAPIFTIDLTSDNQTQNQGFGGGFGGGGGPPPLEITRLSPNISLKPGTSQANLSIKTSRKASCRYSRNKIPGGISFKNANKFNSKKGILHSKIIRLTGSGTYSYSIFCKAENVNNTKSVIFSVGKKEISAFKPFLPATITPANTSIIQGGSRSQPFSIFNNGSKPIELQIKATSKCCKSWITNEQGEKITRTTVPTKSEKSYSIHVSVPLSVSPGVYNTEIDIQGPQTTRTQSVSFQVKRNHLVTEYLRLKSRAKALKYKINNYQEYGVKVKDLQKKLNTLQRKLEKANQSIKSNNLTKLRNSVSTSKTKVQKIEKGLEDAELKVFVYKNWWKFGLGFLTIYVLFFITTVIAVPYYRLRVQLVKIENQLQD